MVMFFLIFAPNECTPEAKANASVVNTHHFLGSQREAALRSALLENLIFGGVHVYSDSLVPGFHRLHAGFEQ